MRFVFPLFCTAFLWFSCNTYDIANRHVSAKLIQGGLTPKEARFKDYTIRYWDSESEKPPLVLLHGFGPPTQFQWYKQIKAFHEDYRLILPNMLYFDGSTAEKPSYSIADQVEALQSLLQLLNVDDYILCGASYGGLVAAELALTDRRRIRKLILLDAPVKFFTEEDLQPMYEKYGVSSPEDLLVPKDPKMLKEMLDLVYKNPPKYPLWVFRDPFREMVIPYMEERKKILNNLIENQALYADRDYDFSFPVLLVWGSGDPLVPVHVGAELEKHIGETARLVVIPNTAHMPNLEVPKVFNKIVRAFLKE